MRATPPNFEKGTVVAGKCEIEDVIGQGGMGVVVAARHRDLDDRVAIKFLLPDLTEQTEPHARFLVEARAARKLKTEHVAKVSDVGTMPDSGAPFIVMELLEGRDLGSLLRTNGPLPIATAVEYLLQACVAIAEAHTQGIIHRDLKPPNLFLGSPLKRTRFALQKNPWNLTQPEHERLALVQQHNQPLYRAYLLKEAPLSV